MYNHFMQINPFCCGAACMQMVYDHFGISISQESIWESIARLNSSSGIDCGPESMQKHFHSHGLCSMYAVDICDIDLFLTWVTRHNLSAIINYSLGKNHHHFVVFERAYANGTIVQDPSDMTTDTFIPYEQLLAPQVILIAPLTHSCRCPYCNTLFPSCDTFSWLYARHVAHCAYCGNELIYTMLT